MPADVVVDLHGGDLDEDLRPYSYWFRGGKPAQDSAGLKLVMAFGLDHVIVSDVNAETNPGRSLSTQALRAAARRCSSPKPAGAASSRRATSRRSLRDLSTCSARSDMLPRKVTPLRAPGLARRAGLAHRRGQRRRVLRGGGARHAACERVRSSATRRICSAVRPATSARRSTAS